MSANLIAVGEISEN